jgi:L-iditol 2-dehydrogenase
LLIPARFVRSSTYRCPPSLSYELAALTEPLACVLHGIDQCPRADNEAIAVFGAGPIGLMFTAVLASRGHTVTLVDRIQARLEVGLAMGAAATVQAVDGDAHIASQQVPHQVGQVDVVIEATGHPEAWTDAFGCVRPGGTIVLYGGYPPEAHVSLDAHTLHYAELTIRGAYHHRPSTVHRAIDLLASGSVDLTPLLSEERPLDAIEDALQAMALRQALKVVIRP